MNILDVLALLIIAFSVVTALMKGLSGELIWLASVIVGFLVAVHSYQEIAYRLVERGWSPIPAGFAGFIGIFVGFVVLGSIVNMLSKRLLKTLRMRWLDRLLGGAFGFLRGAIIVTVIFLALTAFPIQEQVVEESRLAPYFLNAARVIAAAAPSDFQSLYDSSYDRVYRLWLEHDRQAERTP